MPNILFFDTETTGLLPYENHFKNIEAYPRLVQLSALLYSHEGDELESLNMIVKPLEFVIPNAHIHGISNEIADKEGKDVLLVLECFKKICSKADLIVCHNYIFDSTIIKVELLRLQEIDFLLEKRSFCTMTECDPLAKSISLKDLHYKLFKKDFSGHHDAYIDVSITAKCFFHMLKQGTLVEKNNNYYYQSILDKEFNISLDHDNVKFYNAFNLISETRKNIFLTGKAGTGKTTFLKYLRTHTNKNIVTLAFTGVAAINAGGQTINSFFQLPPRPFLPDDRSLSRENIFTFLKYTSNKREIINNVDILVIDEVSMVRSDIIDAIDKILRIFRKKEQLPFGGVQLIFIGDLFQLPPIEADDWSVIKAFYKSPYFFDSNVVSSLVNNNGLVCIELDKVYRQTEIEFIDILNRIRVGKHSNSDLTKLNSPNNRITDVNFLLSDNYIMLATTNKRVDSINYTKLNEIKSPSFIFEGVTEENFLDSMKVAPQRLELKLGAQVMLLKNIGNNYNGKIGKVTEIGDHSVLVAFDGNTYGDRIEKVIWANIEYKYNKEEHRIEETIKGSYKQLPLKLAWSITVHKSQGLTFSKVIADVSSAFASGQVYVALSRCTSLNSLKFITPLPSHAIKIDTRVVEFSEIQTPETTIVNFINEGKADGYYQKFKKLLLNNKVEDAFDSLDTAIKYRNDIFTVPFKKYISAYIDKYNNYKKIINYCNSTIGILKQSIGDINNELFQLKERLLSVTNNFERLLKTEKNNNQQLTNKIIDLTNSSNILSGQIATLKKELSSSESEKQKVINENKALLNKLRTTEVELQQKNRDLNDLSGRYSDMKNKLNTIKDKWYVKIFD